VIKRLLAVAVITGGFALPVFADSIDLPERVGKSLGGSYVLRAELFTNNSVTDLQYNAFRVSSDGRIGAQIPGTDVRPKRVNTRSGQKKRVLVTFPGDAVEPGETISVCMWRPPTIVNNTGGSALASAFRYCKLTRIAD